jgi:hypothetical protein
MSTQTLDAPLLTPTSPVALSWKVVEHETPYTLQYRNGIPYIFGPADEMDLAAIAPSSSHRFHLPHLEKGHWWKLAGLGVIASFVTLILLLPIAFATATDPAPKSALAIAGITSTLDARAAANESRSVVLLSEGEREIAAYQDAHAFATISSVAAASKDSVVTANADGSVIYYSKSTPDHVYMTYEALPYQIEIFDPAPGAALKLAKTPGLIDSLLS